MTECQTITTVRFVWSGLPRVLCMSPVPFNLMTIPLIRHCFCMNPLHRTKTTNGLTLAVLRSCSPHRIIKFKYDSLAAQMILLLLKHDLNGLISANLRLEEQNESWVNLILSLVTPQSPSICKIPQMLDHSEKNSLHSLTFSRNQ